MKVSKRSVFTFEVEAENEEEAVANIIAELNDKKNAQVATAMSDIVANTQINAMQMMLLEDTLKKIDPNVQNIPGKVKELTDLDLTAENFAAILDELNKQKP